ncbi:T-cell receptor gamma alternate reading frame protein isoform X2 [Sagmatias obliquidens]|uniref:T-cell receptor gamma alternate reading frame protein isoform X2 n=1 Tax=Sagmatias obliquidens TaxID=3371155 RepID=UPI000F441F5E|nr:TCR gamma alternate reading frame protein isoform X2 [Lagenorhynchus obliquidens]
MALPEAILFSSLWAFGLGQLKSEQPEISVTGVRDKSVVISCKVSSQDFSKEYIHWYRHKPNQGMEHLGYVETAPAPKILGGKKNKIEARKDVRTSTSTLNIRFLEKEDEATYYCAWWVYPCSGWIKIFGGGTKLIVTLPDRSLDGDMSPKPTIFLPSIDEINLHEAGTHLCLLEKFFPDVIKVYWKEKNGNRVLESQQGNIIKTNDTYMKFSWLTVTKKSMDNELLCIVKHENNKRGIDQEILFPSIENNKRGIDQEILFPSINKEVTTPACVKKGSDSLQLQLTNTCACYTYLLLLLKSLVYFVIISFCVCRRTAVCGHGKSS